MNKKIKNRQCGLRREFGIDPTSRLRGVRQIQLAPAPFIVHLKQFDLPSDEDGQVAQISLGFEKTHRSDSRQVIYSHRHFDRGGLIRVKRNKDRAS